MSKLQFWERDNSDVNGSQIKGQWGSHNAELLALIKWLVSVFMAALLLLHKGRKELISQVTTDQARVPWHHPVSHLGLGPPINYIPIQTLYGSNWNIYPWQKDSEGHVNISLVLGLGPRTIHGLVPPPSWCLLVSICPQLVSPKWQLYSEPISLQSKPTPSLVLWHSAFIKPTVNSFGLDSNSLQCRNYSSPLRSYLSG